MPQSPLARLLLAVFVFSPVLTTVTNTAPVFFGQIGLPGLSPKDGLALVVQHMIVIMPFLLARPSSA